MKAFKVKYRHGHFIDTVTKQRILPVQGKEYIINAEADAFKADDEKLRKLKPKDAKEKFNAIAAEYAGSHFVKLVDAGTRLFYRVGNSKKADGDESKEYLFSCQLLEDLYIYLMPKRKGESSDDWRMCECVCQIDACLEGNLALNENILAPSLNWLFGLTVMFYFNMQRSASCNAFDTFFLLPAGKPVYMCDAKAHIYQSLGDLRRDFYKTYIATQNGKAANPGVK